MNIQSSTSNYIRVLKQDELKKGLPDELFLDKAKKRNAKAKYEIKTENGYIRHYVTKLNGDRVMVKEVKLRKGQEDKNSSGELVDVVRDALMTQLTQQLDKQNTEKFSQTGWGGQKEKQLEKYQTGI
ncbi:hypothetical protein [Psychrobacillus sp.]|uniref:hypothetical protein n=1 Tax=Psychrobacillus sp. TaxID=1871623 RepID=UPI0028BE2C22|nr:hypothetical protein [Psychrobacillus sp.]